MNELTGRRVGYARVSTDDQRLDMQVTALKAAGCDTIWTDKASAGAKRRPGLANAMADLEVGDTLVIWKLDRLARNARQLYTLTGEMQDRGVHLYSISDKIDTDSPMGKVLFAVLAAMAELERDQISERTRAGMAEARRRGKRFGNAQKVTRKMAVEMRALRRKGYDAKRIADSINSNFGLRGKNRIGFRSVYNYWDTNKRPLPRD